MSAVVFLRIDHLIGVIQYLSNDGTEFPKHVIFKNNKRGDLKDNKGKIIHSILKSLQSPFMRFFNFFKFY